jgi:integrase
MKRDTWHRDDKAPGIYWRLRSNGRTKSWAYFDTQVGRIVTVAGARKDAIDAKGEARQRARKGLPAPDRRKLIRDLAEDVRETKRRKLRPGVFLAFEYALDSIVLSELGDYSITAVGPDRCARLIRELEDGKVTGNKLAPASVRRYLTPLSAIFKLAVRRGIIASNPLEQLADDERATGGGVRDHHEWSPAEISALIAASETLGAKPTARFDYSPLIRLLILTGLRISEALALRKRDVDLLGAALHVRHSWARNGELNGTKTEAGTRSVPLSPGLVDLFARIIPADADEDDFVFASKSTRRRPVSYWNFRRRGFVPALETAELAGKGITVHGLRSAAISIYASSGMTLAETAEVMGQADPLVTWRHYVKLFDRSRVNERIREAQQSIENDL